MRDVIFVLIVVVFFVGSVAYTSLCDHIVGDGDASSHTENAVANSTEDPADVDETSTPPVTTRSTR